MPTFEEKLRLAPEDDVAQIGSFIIVRCRTGLKILRDIAGIWTLVSEISKGREFTVGTTGYLLTIGDDGTVVLLEKVTT